METMTPEEKLSEMGLRLPPPARPMGIYRPILLTGPIATVSGHGPLKEDGSLIAGRVGQDLDAEAGQAAARQTGLAILATLKDQLGSLDRVRRVIHLMGMVNADPEFRDHPQVINGCSRLFRDVFGPENGVGTRSAVGMASLPGGMAVEIESTFEIAP